MEIKRQRLVDAALVVLCLALAALAVKAHWSALPRPVIAAAGVAGCAAQWWRRRLPQLAAIAGAGAYALSGNPGPLLLGLYSGGTFAPRRQVWWLAGAGFAGIAGWSWIDEGGLHADDIWTSALAAAVIAGVGVHAATRQALRDSLQERADRAEADRALRDEQARFAERSRIAREMHDVLAHKVSLIAVHAGALELSAGGDPGRARQGAALIRVTAREALHELRAVLGVLQAEPAPFADLTALIEESVRVGQQVDLRDSVGALGPGVAPTVHRIVQEALTNARKHAPGAPVTVSLDKDREVLTVTVHNGAPTGAGLDLPSAGAGLIGLAERVRLSGGTIQSGPSGDGWELRAVLPAPAKDENA